MTKYKCPFCDVELDKNEMRYHVGIPLCMEIRKEISLTEVLKGVDKRFNTPVKKIDMEYYGEENLRKLLSYAFERMTYGHPDADKPIPLEKFRKGNDPFPEESKFEEFRKRLREMGLI